MDYNYRKIQGAKFIRDLLNWIDNRNEHLNQGKTVHELIVEFIEETGLDPNDYTDNGSDWLGLSVQE